MAHLGLGLAGTIFLAVTLAGQSTFRHDVTLVRLLVSVKDQAGEVVGKMGREEFEVFDCDVKQDVAVFERQTAQPLSVSVLIDASGSTLKDVRYETGSIGKFFKALLKEGNPQDKAALYSFNYEVRLLHDFTRDLNKLLEQLPKVKPTAGTSLYDAVHFAGHALQGREGRHVMVIVSDGGDTTSYYKYHDALEAAQKADAVVYGIIVVPISNDAGRNIGGEHTLVQFGQNTGGRVFYPTVADLDKAFAEILLDLRTQYLLGYYPKNLPQDAPTFHRVTVRVKRPDLRVATRSGYYSVVAP
ncbi:MAG TPA: VWA domain-containing protein [Bryobacteraceae bacterium]|nr:VWA domain-containing protein [Bryobacteraceae bacterium]